MTDDNDRLNQLPFDSSYLLEILRSGAPIDHKVNTNTIKHSISSNKPLTNL